MQNTHTPFASTEQQQAHPSAHGTLNNLGEHVHCLLALLRAAINVDTNHPDDEGWLVSLAYTQAQQLQKTYNEWANAPTEGAE
jgi:hypothetical protein